MKELPHVMASSDRVTHCTPLLLKLTFTKCSLMRAANVTFAERGSFH
jgi:hypothetical protein